MGMKVLLTMQLDPATVREACAEWARARAVLNEAATTAVLGVPDAPVTVEFRRATKREQRKALLPAKDLPAAAWLSGDGALVLEKAGIQVFAPERRDA